MSMQKYDPNAFKPLGNSHIVLDFTACRHLGEIHAVLKNGFGLPDYYGENWDALWDCLRYLFADGTPITVDIHGFLKLHEELRSYCVTMLELFDDLHRESPNVKFKVVS